MRVIPHRAQADLAVVEDPAFVQDTPGLVVAGSAASS
jgi:hypothetical protein